MQSKIAGSAARHKRIKDFTTFRGYLNAVVHSLPLTIMQREAHVGDNTGIVKQLAVALFVPLVTGVFTALVTGYVAQAVLTERFNQMQVQTEKNLDRMSQTVERLATKVDRNDEQTKSWIIQHERDQRGQR